MGLGIAGLAASTSCLSHGTDGSLMNQLHGRYSWILRASCATHLSPLPHFVCEIVGAKLPWVLTRGARSRASASCGNGVGVAWRGKREESSWAT